MQKSVSQQPLSCIKEGWGQQTSISLKHLNNFIPSQHFKMEGLNLLQNMLQKRDYMCQLDLKGACFCVPFKKESRKYVRFQWEGTLYKFLSLCFGLGPAALIFTKILKVQISLLRMLQIRVIIYLDDTLLVSQTLEELLMSKDTINFFSDLIRICYQFEKVNPSTSPTNRISRLGDSVKMKLFFPQRKVEEIIWMS